MDGIDSDRRMSRGRKGTATEAFLIATAISLLAAPARAQESPRVRAGAHFSINPAQFEVREGRLGAQVVVPALRIFELVPALGYYVRDEFEGRAWQAGLHARIRPLGPGTTSPLYVGAGASMLRHGGGTVFYDLEVLGLEFHAGRISLFTELLLYGLLDDGPTGDDALNVVVGFNVPFSP